MKKKMTKEDERLLAFFAANSTEDDIKRYRIGRGADYKIIIPEMAKMYYAKNMLDKYKEF